MAVVGRLQSRGTRRCAGSNARGGPHGNACEGGEDRGALLLILMAERGGGKDEAWRKGIISAGRWLRRGPQPGCAHLLQTRSILCVASAGMLMLFCSVCGMMAAPPWRGRRHAAFLERWQLLWARAAGLLLTDCLSEAQTSDEAGPVRLGPSARDAGGDSCSGGADLSGS